MKTTVALETLGCKVNQYESSFIMEALREAGLQPASFRERADIYIVHSCAVTSRAAFETRQLLRRAEKLNPSALIVALGCDAQVESARLASETPATHILGTEEKLDILRRLQTPATASNPYVAVGDSRLCTEFTPLPVSGMLSGRARSFLKIQDGCDSFCSYCIVPYSRGRSRSLPAVDVRSQMDRLLASGYREVVLTGIHLGQWGKSFAPRQHLADLLAFLQTGPLPSRIRFSSLEPLELSADLLERIVSMPEICPHFHIPLQSGDGEILERMQRPYTPAYYEETILALRRIFPRAALGADILVGFPGETERHFQNTFDLAKRLPLTYFHVFPFSPRPGTPAASWQGRVTGGELKRRTGLLRELGLEKKRAFQERSIGKWIEVLVETEVKPGLWKGTSENYLQTVFPAERPLLPGTLVKVRPTRAKGACLIGIADM